MCIHMTIMCRATMVYTRLPFNSRETDARIMNFWNTRNTKIGGTMTMNRIANFIFAVQAPCVDDMQMAVASVCLSCVCMTSDGQNQSFHAVEIKSPALQRSGRTAARQFAGRLNSEAPSMRAASNLRMNAIEEVLISRKKYAFAPAGDQKAQ